MIKVDSEEIEAAVDVRTIGNRRASHEAECNHSLQRSLHSHQLRAPWWMTLLLHCMQCHSAWLYNGSNIGGHSFRFSSPQVHFSFHLVYISCLKDLEDFIPAALAQVARSCRSSPVRKHLRLFDASDCSIMPSTASPSREERLTLSQLASYDDVLTDALIDRVCNLFRAPKLTLRCR